ncbi:MAG: alkaline phosphatase family protein [Candidatus Acidiferrum sp.]
MAIRKWKLNQAWVFLLAFGALTTTCLHAQTTKRTAAPATARTAATKPKLVVMIVVDQMRGDYVDKFRPQWTAGLKRLLDEGAWFREAAYPYAATETCVGHATVSTGAFPATHGMVANAWWDRELQKMVTCTSDPSVKNIAYAGKSTKGGDSAVSMLVPAYAEELKFQTGQATRVVTLSLKARAAITMAGHKADAATWFDTSAGSWVTSSAYGTAPFVEEFANKHPATEDYGKTWALSLPVDSYLYDGKAIGVSTVTGWATSFPHPMRGKEGATQPDESFLEEWTVSPFADTALTRLAESAVDSLSLGKNAGTDYLGISYSSVDYVGHIFGPRSWEIQDILVKLDKDLGELFTHLDQKVGRGNYIVALTADHGVAPVPEDMTSTGVSAGVLSLPELKERIEKALRPFSLPTPAIARIAGNDVYFSPGVYEKLRENPAAISAVIGAALAMPGVESVYKQEDLADASKTLSETRNAFASSYHAGRSGDLFVLQKPYWLTDSSAEGAKRYTGTGHGTPYYYDQRVPILFMGFGVQSGEYFGAVTPADIAPTFAALTGVTLSTRDGRVLAEMLQKRHK